MTGAARIAVYGASGHTGRLVAAELAARGQDLVLVGRDPTALRAVAAGLDGRPQVRVADLDHAPALHAALSNAAVVINCAGPFSRSCGAVASAAAATGSHYLDHAAEPLVIKNLFADLQARARAARTVAIPSMSFYGATADLLTAWLGQGQARTNEITVAYAVSGWRMTSASKQTAQLLAATEAVTYDNGEFHVGPPTRTLGTFDFPAPIGVKEVLMNYPAGAEIVTIPRHQSAQSVHVLMTTETFQEESVYTSEDLDAAGRACSEFVLVVQITSDEKMRRGVIQGRDIYRVGALMAVEAALDLAHGRVEASGGVHSAAEVFDPAEFLGRQQNLGSFTITV